MESETMTVIDEIAAERRRQIEVEGWTAKHDDQHIGGVLAQAAAAYAMAGSLDGDDRDEDSMFSCRMTWPFEREWFKPTTPRRDLIKAAALIVAEIERLDRIAP